MAMACVTGPHSLVCLIIVGNSGALVLSAKVQPSLVSTVAVVDILQILEVGFLWVFLVELRDEIG